MLHHLHEQSCSRAHTFLSPVVGVYTALTGTNDSLLSAPLHVRTHACFALAACSTENRTGYIFHKKSWLGESSQHGHICRSVRSPCRADVSSVSHSLYRAIVRFGYKDVTDVGDEFANDVVNSIFRLFQYEPSTREGRLRPLPEEAKVWPNIAIFCCGSALLGSQSLYHNVAPLCAACSHCKTGPAF